MSRLTGALTSGAIPPSAWTEPSAIEGAVARRIVRVGALLAAVAAAGFGVFYGIAGPASFFVPNMIAAAVFLLVVLLPRLSPTSRLYLIVFNALALFGVQLLQVASIDNGITVWFVVPTVGALLVGARRPAAITAVAAVLELTGVVVAARAGWLTPTAVLTYPDLVMLVCTLSILALCGMFAAIARRGREELRVGLEASHESLVAALADATAAQRDATEAAEAKDRFFANLTHEIRTPLNGIAGSAELLAEADLAPEHRELAQTLAQSSAHLVALVNAMLSHARLRAGTAVVEPGPLEVRRLAGELDDLFRPPASAKGLAFAVKVAPDVPAWIETDPVKVRQIVTNLVGNAIKFTPSGSVHCWFGRGPGAGPDGPASTRLEVTVHDTGIGIPDALVDQVFEPFVQAEAHISRAHGGTGLGLAIARQLAELLGGTLTATSRVGEGSTFVLSVPVLAIPAPVPSEDDRAPVSAAPPATTRAPRVLLAEDNPLNRTVACRMLARLGAEAVAAEDGHRAVELATAEPFDLVLMDLQMPGLDGIGAARRIREHERAAGRSPVRLVAMTGNAPDDYAVACAEAGMDGFVVKPVDLAGIRALLDGIGGATARPADGVA